MHPKVIRSSLGHLMFVAGVLSKKLNLDDTFNIVINNGEKMQDKPFFICTLHLLSGKSLDFFASLIKNIST